MHFTLLGFSPAPPPHLILLTGQFATIQVFHGKGLTKPRNSDVDSRGVGYAPGGFIENHSVSPKGGSREKTIIIVGGPLPTKAILPENLKGLDITLGITSSFDLKTPSLNPLDLLSRLRPQILCTGGLLGLWSLPTGPGKEGSH